MPLVEEDAVDDAFDGLVDRSVREDDVGRLAAELERVFLRAAGERLLDDAADFRRTGEGDLVDARVRDDVCPRIARAGNDVDDAVGAHDADPRGLRLRRFVFASSVAACRFPPAGGLITEEKDLADLETVLQKIDARIAELEHN